MVDEGEHGVWGLGSCWGWRTRGCEHHEIGLHSQFHQGIIASTEKVNRLQK